MRRSLERHCLQQNSRRKTGTLEPRRYPPSDGEIRDWCEGYQVDLWKLAGAGELIDRPWETPRPAEPEKPRPPPTAEEVAHVWARVNEIRERAKRIAGEPTEEERRACAERIVKGLGGGGRAARGERNTMFPVKMEICRVVPQRNDGL